jgi:hypothetical protein
MNNNNDEELSMKEKELKMKENAIRLREMEVELYKNQNIPFYQTEKLQKSEGKFKHFLRKIVKFAKFLGIVVCVVIAIKLALSLTLILMVLVISWISYKIFVQKE